MRHYLKKLPKDFYQMQSVCFQDHLGYWHMLSVVMPGDTPLIGYRFRGMFIHIYGVPRRRPLRLEYTAGAMKIWGKPKRTP